MTNTTTPTNPADVLERLKEAGWVQVQAGHTIEAGTTVAIWFPKLSELSIQHRTHESPVPESRAKYWVPPAPLADWERDLLEATTASCAACSPVLPDEVMKQLVSDLVEMDRVEAISLATWPAAQRLVAEYHLSPPPVPREPWHDLSTDREKPTLAKVTWEPGSPDGLVGQWWLDGDFLCRVGDSAWRRTKSITAVTVLATPDSSTHVPVERALIDEAAQLVAWYDGQPLGGDTRHTIDIVRSLAALADGNQS